MGIFSSIIDKIFHHPAAQAAAPAPDQPAPAADAPVNAPAAAVPPEVAPAPAQVDVGAVLEQMAAAKGGGGSYESSIVDLLKLLDLDSR
jgi:hypothetical protein